MRRRKSYLTLTSSTVSCQAFVVTTYIGLTSLSVSRSDSASWSTSVYTTWHRHTYLWKGPVVRNLQTFSVHIRTTLFKYTSVLSKSVLWRYFREASLYSPKLRYNFSHAPNLIRIRLILSLVISFRFRVKYLKVTRNHVTSLHFPCSVPSFGIFWPTPFPFPLITFLFFTRFSPNQFH